MDQESFNTNRIKKYLSKEEIAKYYSNNSQNNFEDSNIKARYIAEDDIENSDRFKNIKDLDEYLKMKNVTKYNFGDLISFSSYRDTATIIIGKNGKLIKNPDYSGSGYLTIPYEITQYLNDATNKYKNHEVNCIDLRHDDKFIKDNIGEIPQSWNFKFTKIDEMIHVKFPNEKVNDFNIYTTSEDIYNFYIGSQKEQANVKFSYSLNGRKYPEFRNKYGYQTVPPNLNKTWSTTYGSYESGTEYANGNLYFKGPIDELKNVLDILKNYYNGFEYKIQVT